MRFTRQSLKPEIRTQAFMYGVSAWTRDQYPTSTFTYYSTFEHFNTTSEHYYFQRMVHPTPALYVNTKTLHERVMFVWIACVLDEDCIKPSGAQSAAGWCNLERRPRYLYSGCHRYSTSAFNIALGQAFDIDAPYASTQQLFHIQQQEPFSFFIRCKEFFKILFHI